ncbi:MAG TPA: ABC transporter permease [Aggregatilineales bacterium]|nr:ABC transporter permease [Anaerolineales bacterium]HRE47119.1 ABC transporter permease [Aggregatilineales bacterium]
MSAFKQTMTNLAISLSKMPARLSLRRLTIRLFCVGAAVLLAIIAYRSYTAPPDSPLVTDSTLGELGAWVAGRVGDAAPEYSALIIKTMLLIQAGLAALGVGMIGIALLRFERGNAVRSLLLVALILADVLIFLVPVLEGDSTAFLVQTAIFFLLVGLLIAPGKATKVLGFIVVLSALLLGWEVFKGFAAAVDYKITLPLPAYSVTTYPDIDAALDTLQSGVIDAVIVDKKVIDPLVPAADAANMGDLPHPSLRYLTRFEGEPRQLTLPLIPPFPKRSVVIVRGDEVGRYTSVADLVGSPLGTVAGDFAEGKFLYLPRQWQLVELSIGNDLKLPHLQVIAESLLQPARRNGPDLLLSILIDSARVTWGKAIVGFLLGVALGFLLGSVFAHSRLLERGLLPYVVASQTVPILAIAPMVVIWLKDQFWSVAIIAAYLTFFPVTINTLRGLRSPNPNSLELMHTYAASRWAIFWKLRFPSALPYIFTALKVSATASVVGTIIGELPSGIGDGLGRAILNFNQYYATGPEKLWAAIFIAALLGITFFLIVAAVEAVVLPKTMREG